MGNSLSEARLINEELAKNKLAFYTNIVTSKQVEEECIPALIVTFIVFVLLYKLADYLLKNVFKAEFYTSKSHYETIIWRADLVDIASHLTFPTWAFIILLNACPEKSDLGWFGDLECRLTPVTSFPTLVAAYIGFLIYDTVIKIKMYQYNSKHLLSVFHHFVAMTGWITSSIAGFGSPGCGIALTLVDSTSVFLCAKAIIPSSTWPITAGVNKVIFVVTFTVIRIFANPFLVYWCIFEMLAGWDFRTDG